jgi:glutamate-ammonia-ligase adenylyltransferase
MLPVLNHLCQWLCRLLAESVDGDRVFQVDLRLRPQGKDGELAPSLAAAADHYLLHGRPWERQMLLKARPVAGDRSLGTVLLREVRPFVFRRFLDFQALDELRAMRDRILVEAVRPHTGWEQFDVKLGIGGIREIEFLVQSFQLIYGGRHPELDEPNTLRCLERLSSWRCRARRWRNWERLCVPERVEHWVQLDQNRQTQKLPRSEDARMRLALALGFEGNERDFLEQLRNCCTTVHEHFLGLFAVQPQTGQVQLDPAITGQPPDNIDARWDDLGKVFPAEQLVRLRDCLRHFAPPVHRAVQAVLGRYEFLRKAIRFSLKRSWCAWNAISARGQEAVV